MEHNILQMEEEYGLDRNAAIAEMRYDFIERVCRETVIKCQESKQHRRSVQIDRILTNKYAALPIFFGIMLLIFFLTFNVIGAGLSDLLAAGINLLSTLADRALSAFGVNPVVQSLIIDGIFAGVGSVLSFLPLIVVLFFFLSILEDTGYMARVAFVMDKLLRKIGLSGRSIVPMLIGFGCTVPAVMATRTLSSERDRKMTILLTPFMSCSAKIPIYVVFCAAFFQKYQALVMIGLYLLGILFGILAALILDHTAFRGKPVPFVMELPNYRCLLYTSFNPVGCVCNAFRIGDLAGDLNAQINIRLGNQQFAARDQPGFIQLRIQRIKRRARNAGLFHNIAQIIVFFNGIIHGIRRSGKQRSHLLSGHDLGGRIKPAANLHILYKFHRLAFRAGHIGRFYRFKNFQNGFFLLRGADQLAIYINAVMIADLSGDDPIDIIIKIFSAGQRVAPDQAKPAAEHRGHRIIFTQGIRKAPLNRIDRVGKRRLFGNDADGFTVDRHLQGNRIILRKHNKACQPGNCQACRPIGKILSLIHIS